MRVVAQFVILTYMKENFERSLLEANEQISSYKRSQTDEERSGLRKEFDETAGEFIREGIWSRETSAEILGLQKEKNDVMDQLHEKIRSLENNEEVAGFSEGEPRRVEWNKAGHRAMVVLPSGKKAPATVGELVTDGEWGLHYILSEDIPRDIKKRFIIAEARRKILALADKQIIETERMKKTTHEGGETSPTYRAIYEEEKSKKKMGIIAEKLTKTFFQKNIIDHELDMRLEEVDVQRDVDQKIDFILHLPFRKRGVGSEASEKRENIGIQLTINTEKKNQEHKKRQVAEAKKHLDEDVDDLVLVTLPLNELYLLLHRWEEDEMRPGGPIKKWWKDSQKEQIFRGVLQELFSDQEITGMWQSISGEDSDINISPEEMTDESNLAALDESGKKNLDAYNQRFGKWFGKKG